VMELFGIYSMLVINFYSKAEVIPYPYYTKTCEMVARELNKDRLMHNTVCVPLDNEVAKRMIENGK
jgi:hypothetical protein